MFFRPTLLWTFSWQVGSILAFRVIFVVVVVVVRVLVKLGVIVILLKWPWYVECDKT